MWLTPREPLRSALRSIIHGLATTLDAVEFEPHVTVFSGRSSEDAARAIARDIAGRFPPLDLTAVRLDHTQVYTKTLFVTFRESATLRRMFEVARRYAPQSAYALNPHLSLLYLKIPEAKRREFSETLDFPRGDYGFDRIRLVETESPIEDAGPIQRWRSALDEPLLGR